MMEIELTNAGKRYNRDWIFRRWTALFKAPNAYVITGSNGSGKSTALRTLLGYSPLSEGSLIYRKGGVAMNQEAAYRNFSICAPYLELYEELTLDELVRFHFSLKPMLPEIDQNDFAAHVQLDSARTKQVKHFSSGMKQRLRLGLALLSNTPVVLLDEPVSNLDKRSIAWYSDLVSTYRGERLIVVASNNQTDEYAFCGTQIHIEDFKPS